MSDLASRIAMGSICTVLTAGLLLPTGIAVGRAHPSSFEIGCWNIFGIGIGVAWYFLFAVEAGPVAGLFVLTVCWLIALVKSVATVESKNSAVMTLPPLTEDWVASNSFSTLPVILQNAIVCGFALRELGAFAKPSLTSSMDDPKYVENVTYWAAFVFLTVTQIRDELQKAGLDTADNVAELGHWAAQRNNMLSLYENVHELTACIKRITYMEELSVCIKRVTYYEKGLSPASLLVARKAGLAMFIDAQK
ncbi:MAG: hypothetical protein Q7U16_06975 [Agitococcus sp.]|nr:hypothetical protein [Agitococcus sp.]